MINTSKFAVIAAVAAAGIVLPALAQAATPTHRHHYKHRTLVGAQAAPGYRANAAIAPGVDPVDDPAMTGGGTPGYNACAGHPRC
jgi:hypothetical protein